MKPARWFLIPLVLAGLASESWITRADSSAGSPLAGTRLLTGTNDLAADMVEGLHRFLDREGESNVVRRAGLWKWGNVPFTLETFVHRFDSNRVRFRQALGVSDPRDARGPVTLRQTTVLSGAPATAPREIARGPGYQVFAVSWTVFRGVEGEGLLLLPDGEPKGDVIAIPDCETTPEQFAGLVPGLEPSQQLARLCAEQGCRVIVPCLIDRSTEPTGVPGLRSTGHSKRETLWRAGYEMGRTVIGYELQRVLAAADWLEQTRRPGTVTWEFPEYLKSMQSSKLPRQFLGIVGHGEGGLLALYAAACDTRFHSAYVSGYFGPKEQVWQQPIDRNVFGWIREFGDAEVGALVAPRVLWIETGAYPEVIQTDAKGGAPGKITRPNDNAVTAEHERLQRIAGSVAGGRLNNRPDRFGDYLSRFLFSLTGSNPGVMFKPGPAPAIAGALPNAGDRALRLYRQLLDDTQWLMHEGEYARRDFWARADFKSADAFIQSAGAYRAMFWTNVVGYLPPATVAPDPRTRFLGETNGVRRYEVVLQVYPEVFAQGILCVPSGIPAGERRPVVVCQHGLEGRPVDVSDPAIQSQYYHQYGLRLAERGFVTFAPQNPYIGGTKFRQVLHQAQPLGLTLWSFIIRQHEVITDWLAAQEFVDPQRIAFYGLSYGGKSAMRIPILVPRYCLSICSADYNEWIWKNVSARAKYSYLFNNEYDMPEWNLGNTFNYAEMSWLIFPRPFMVERGHDDGVAPDEWVAYEYAKTRRHYVKLGLSERTEIEFFDGPHSIHGVGTFAFLHRHLNWPAPR